MPPRSITGTACLPHIPRVDPNTAGGQRSSTDNGKASDRENGMKCQKNRRMPHSCMSLIVVERFSTLQSFVSAGQRSSRSNQKATDGEHVTFMGKNDIRDTPSIVEQPKRTPSIVEQPNTPRQPQRAELPSGASSSPCALWRFPSNRANLGNPQASRMRFGNPSDIERAQRPLGAKRTSTATNSPSAPRWPSSNLSAC